MTTLVYTTARPQPKFEWLFSSLLNCSGREIISQIIIVDFFAQACDEWTTEDCVNRFKSVMAASAEVRNVMKPELNWIPPKPNVWAGKHRLTPRNWWHKSSALNTGLCLTKNEYVVFSDDRCVLVPTFLDAVREAKDKKHVVCGTYQKRTGMVYEDGLIKEHGDLIGSDSRAAVAQGRKMKCPGTWMFGHAFGLPTEWMLEVNGVDESWDSVSMEDTHFGQMLDNCGYPIFHDPRMGQLQDRSESSPSHDMKRSSKEKHPHDKNDKTHKLIEKLWSNKKAAHQWDLRKIREQTLMGVPFPIPTEPKTDWFDSQPLAEMI